MQMLKLVKAGILASILHVFCGLCGKRILTLC